ncbi:multicopper oxidase [Azorhizobium sp. AG788]|nr:multicopper oxidase [Azorhizobium sp. AG788]
MMTQPFSASLSRRAVLAGGVAAGALALSGRWNGARAAPLITVESVSLDVNGKAAKVYAIQGPAGEGVFAKEGDRFAGAILNAAPEPAVMHWHGQIFAPPDQDRARPDGGALASGASDQVDFPLTPGTHWMHSHTLSEQQLLAAPLVTREADAGDVQDVVLMLHDFSFRTPEEILVGLGGANGHGAHGGHNMGGTGGAATGGTSGGGMSMAGMDHSGHNMGSMGGMGAMASGGAMNHSGHSMPGGAMGGSAMVHANDVDYDAFLANRRTLADPQVVPVEKGGRVRLRIINGGTASAFFISVPSLKPRCVAVDGTPCVPLEAALFPLAQGQRIDLVVDVPAGGGAFPVLAQVEASPRRTGLVLATPGASVARITDTADTAQGLLSLELEGRLSAAKPLAARKPDKSFSLLLGEQPGYRWTINGAVYGEAPPFVVNQGERVEMTFMNPTSMNHPMHLHGHHFQVVGIGTRRFSGAMRDTVNVPPRTPVTIAFDAGPKGDWFLHCHHLYHMATGMMGVVRVA